MATKKLLWLVACVLACLCITPRGLAVCCLPDGSCTTQGQVACENAGGCFLGSETDCANVICQAQDYFIFLDLQIDELIFNKFDDLGGTRELLEVKVCVGTTATEAITLQVLPGRQTCVLESQTAANFNITSTASFKDVAGVPTLNPLDARSTLFGGPLDPRFCGDPDPIDEVVLCPPAPTLDCPTPCPNMCDYGGAFTFEDGDEFSTTDANLLCEFIAGRGPAPACAPMAGDTTFRLNISGNAIWTVSGGFFQFSNPTNEAEGPVIVIYRFRSEGACCLPNGTCVDNLTEDECLAMNGVYQGDSTTCAPTGACCLPNNTCIVTSEACCLNVGGTYGGDGSACGPSGACCLPNGTCVNLTEICCTRAGGTFSAGACSGNTGACCLPGGTCVVINQTCCVQQGGSFQGNGTVCGPTGACCLPGGTCVSLPEICCTAQGGTFSAGACSGNTGACCLPNGTCISVNETCCIQQGGTFLGGACSGNTGACCLPNGTCVSVNQTCCVAQGGTFIGGACGASGACCLPNGTCVTTPMACCALQGGTFVGGACGGVGACCLPNGTCVQTDAACCALQNGTFIGVGVACGGVGACCLPNGTCSVMSEACCDLQNGNFVGNGTTCGGSGACCLPDGSCTVMIQACCAFAGGAYAGDGTVCGPVGRCCLPDGSCQDNAFETCCELAGGVHDPNLTCGDQPPCVPQDGGCWDKGSLLFFSKVEIRWTNAGVLLQDTFLQLTNDYPANVTVQAYFINGDPPLAANGNERAHPGWNWVDNKVTLTGDQPVYWSALTGLGASGIFDPTFSPFTVLDPGFPPGRPDPFVAGERMLRGFIVLWAVHPTTHVEIRWNHLVGNGTLVHYRDSWAWTYKTCAFPVVANVAHGQPTGMDPGVLNLNGNEYRAAAALLLMNFQATGSTAFSGPRLVSSDTDVTLHLIDADLRQETEGPVTTKAHYLIWNQNEAKRSGAYRCITCWDQTLLSNYGPPNHFSVVALGTNVGKARIDGLASALCDQDLYGPGGPGTPPDGVLDVVSRAAALTGLVAHFLSFDAAADIEVYGENMFDLGAENAVIRYDLQNGPPELITDPSSPEEVQLLIDQLTGKKAGAYPSGR